MINVDKPAILAKLNKFCPAWLKRPDAASSIEEVMQFMIVQVLPGLLIVKVEELNESRIVGSVPYRNDTANVLGYMHGGTIFALGDTLAGAYIWANATSKNYAVTSGSEIKYFKPVKEGTVRCTVIRKSQQDRKITLEATFENNGRVVSLMTLSYHLMNFDANMNG